MTTLDNQPRMKMKKQTGNSFFGTLERPRVVISKSNRYLTIQAVDDSNQHTIAYLCTRDLIITEFKSSSKLKNLKSEEVAEKLGVEFAKALNRKSIKNIVFDRNDYIYHGKIKVLCNKMRDLGINF